MSNIKMTVVIGACTNLPELQVVSRVERVTKAWNRWMGGEREKEGRICPRPLSHPV